MQKYVEKVKNKAKKTKYKPTFSNSVMTNVITAGIKPTKVKPNVGASALILSVCVAANTASLMSA